MSKQKVMTLRDGEGIYSGMLLFKPMDHEVVLEAVRWGLELSVVEWLWVEWEAHFKPYIPEFADGLEDLATEAVEFMDSMLPADWGLIDHGGSLVIVNVHDAEAHDLGLQGAIG